MTHILSLGAVNKQTGEYVYPKIANKKDEDYFNNIKKSKYKFVTQEISLFTPNFPDTTKMTAIEYEENEISICSDIIVDCENNFSEDEKKIIEKFNITPTKKKNETNFL